MGILAVLSTKMGCFHGCNGHFGRSIHENGVFLWMQWAARAFHPQKRGIFVDATGIQGVLSTEMGLFRGRNGPKAAKTAARAAKSFISPKS